MNLDNIIEFVTDPLRLTLIIAGVVVLLAILVFGRRSKRDTFYSGSTRQEHSFSSMPDDMLMDAEVIVLPKRKTESELAAETESHFSANYDESNAPELENAENSETTASADASANVNTRQELPLPGDEPSQQKQQAEVRQESDPQVQAQTQAKEKPASVEQYFVVLHVIAAEGRPFTGRAIFTATQTLGMAIGKHNVFHYPADAAYVGDSAFCMTNMTAEGIFDIENLEELQTNGVSLILTLPTEYSDGLTVFSNMLAVAQALSKKLGGDIIDQKRMPLTAEVVTSMRADIENFESQVRRKSPELEV